MNIAIFSSFLPSTYIGGAEILTELVATQLVRLGHQVTIYTGGNRSTRIVRGYCIRSLPILNPIPFRTLLSPIRTIILRWILRDDDFLHTADIIQTVDVDSTLLLTWWHDIRHKLVAVIQDYGLISPESDLIFENDISIRRNFPDAPIFHTGDYFRMGEHAFFLRFQQYIRVYMKHLSLSRLRYAICVSRFVEKKLIHIAPHIKTTVIGNCVSDVWFDAHRVKKDIDILYVGKFVWYKGVDIFIEAIHDIVRKRSVVVYMIGGGNIAYYRTIIHKFHVEKYVTIVREQKNAVMTRYFRRSKMVVVPSLWSEPCGRTIVEGMATECPVIATNVGGTPESLADGKYGTLVPSGDKNALVDGVIDLLLHGDKRVSIGKRAKQYARDHFSTNQIIQKYESYYRLIQKA